MKLAVTTILCWMSALTMLAAEVQERSLRSANSNAIEKINYDVGFVPVIALGLAILVLASGIKAILASRTSREIHRRWMALHIFVILIVVSVGVFVHSTGMYAIHSAASQTGQVDHVQAAGDRQFVARYDIWFSVIMMMGALLGAIAAITNKPAESGRGRD